MNIVIPFKISQLDTLIEVLKEQVTQTPANVADKCMFYLYQAVLKKLLKKQVDKHADFPCRPFKVTLNYQEATALYLELNKLRFSDNVYTSNVVRTLKTTLHQKLND